MAALGCALGWLGSSWLARSNERVARRVEERLGEALGARCRVAAARIVSARAVEVQGLGCVWEEGHLLGFGIGRASARFEAPPLSRPMPKVEGVKAEDVQIRLSEGTGTGDDDSAAGEDDDSAARSTPGAWRLEREALRFLSITAELDRGMGGGFVPQVRDRLGQGGTVRVERASFVGADGAPLLSDLHAVVERRGGDLDAAIAAALGRGGLLALDVRLSEEGLREARIRLDEIPVAGTSGGSEVAGLEVRRGQASGDLRYLPGEQGGTWSVDVGVRDLVVRQERLGSEWLPLPPLRVTGTLVPDMAGRTLAMRGGEWSVAGEGGHVEMTLGPLGGEDALVDLRVDAAHLRLGRLLGSLPEELMPASWAEEIQGTFDFDLTFGGPVHRRKEWCLDWHADFSRLVLASGNLAGEVARLAGPFPHTFPGVEGRTGFTRLIGPEDPSFVPLSSISSHLVNAVISTEDSGFFAHSGFEETSIKEAVLENLREGGGRGGSTITQQLAKNLFLDGERTFARKLKEAVLAWRLESDLPKQRILEIYLNIAEWGPGIYGARDAADHYFARSPSVLRPEEAAFLASLLPSPRRYHGYYHGSGGITENRYTLVQEVLASMNRLGRLSEVDYQLARGEPIELAPCTWR